MANYSQTLPVNKTLSTTVADAITITPPVGGWVRVLNRDATNTLWVKGAGPAPVAADQTVVPVLPLKEAQVYIGDQIVNTSTTPVVQVVGSAGGYSIYAGAS